MGQIPILTMTNNLRVAFENYRWLPIEKDNHKENIEEDRDEFQQG